MLDGLRVLDLSTEIAGPYCTKLLADAGADVVKAEPPEGDPLRPMTAVGADLAPDDDSALFGFLNASKRSITGEPDALLGSADVIVANALPPGAPFHPAQVVVTITPFGLDGPWVNRPATEFTLQAWCGSTASRGVPERSPVSAGGRVGEYIGGVYAAVATLAAHRTARTTGRGELVDVSLLECMTMTMHAFAWLYASMTGWPEVRGPSRSIEIPSIEPTADGLVGFCTITRQQFHDFLALIERPDLVEDEKLVDPRVRMKRRHEVLETIRTWTTRRTTDEVIEVAAAMRIPVVPVTNGQTVTELEHFQERGVFVTNPAGFIQPRVPYRVHGVEAPPLRRTPRLGEHTGTIEWAPRPPTSTDHDGDADTTTNTRLPLAGVRILDFTAFWAGPAATHALACLGADVVKVESVQRPDGMRFTSARRPPTEQWWEWSPVFHAANAGKRSVTLDLNRDQGRDLVLRLIEHADAVVENFTPRVMEQFGLDWDAVHAANPRTIMVRMPAFGLDGPWRDRTGFAQTTEQVSGMAWVTGYPDGSPLIPRGPCDPFGGMHAVLALLVALERRDRGDGEGRLVEMTLVEAALNAAAQGVVEASAYGQIVGRDGNRSWAAAPQGVYACAGEEEWLALSVANDEQWAALVSVLGTPDWAAHPALATVTGRRAAHDRIDEALSDWCRDRPLDDVVEALAAAGIAAARVFEPTRVVDNPQLQARRFFERPEHPVTGAHPLPGLPFRFDSRRTAPWIGRPAPTVGQHNDEVLGGELGLSSTELEKLRADQIIGDRPVGG